MAAFWIRQSSINVGKSRTETTAFRSATKVASYTYYFIMIRMTCACSARWAHVCIVALIFSILVPSARAFSLRTTPSATCQSATTTRSKTLALVSPIYMAAASDSDDFSIPDKNDVPIRVSSVIQVIKPNLQAHQVPPKGYGMFDDESGEFIPSNDKKTLTIPVGMTGVVTKVYNNAEISANFPIQVKFVPGAFPETKFDPPVPFLMHFLPTEVECVE